MDKVMENLPTTLVEVDHFEFYWFPHTNKCQTVRRHPVKETGFGKVHIICISTIEFGEIPNFSRQAEQPGKLTYMILYFHIEIQQFVF